MVSHSYTLIHSRGSGCTNHKWQFIFAVNNAFMLFGPYQCENEGVALQDNIVYMQLFAVLPVLMESAQPQTHVSVWRDGMAAHVIKVKLYSGGYITQYCGFISHSYMPHCL